MQILSRSKPGNIFLVLFVLTLNSCVTVPRQAPALSEELGLKLSSIEKSHLTLLHSFFDEKRAAVDEYVIERWVPTFAEEFFSNPTINETWNEIVASGNKEDRLKFIVLVGPKLQAKINSKRLEMIKPLDDIEREIEMKIREEYNVARGINNAITSFLYSASKVNENRQRYLDMLGITEEKINKAIDQTDEVVQDLVDKGEGIVKKEEQAKTYLENLKAIKDLITD